uniref:RAS (RAD and GEM)-like GTP binding 2 n=1 Tax=Oryzias sinensis TaxID=183150 RepID=A0A8C7Y9K7_9TELE
MLSYGAPTPHSSQGVLESRPPGPVYKMFSNQPSFWLDTADPGRGTCTDTGTVADKASFLENPQEASPRGGGEMDTTALVVGRVLAPYQYISVPRIFCPQAARIHPVCLCVCDPQDLATMQCDVCILVFSVTDRRSFHRTAQLRLLLRESQPQTPIILVGNKSDLVRSREISSEGGAMMFDCVYLELSASLDHGTNELLEAAVRTARGDCVGPGWMDGDPGAGRRESLTSRAKRFLAGLVPRSKIFRQKSRSCHDLSAL